MRFYMRTGTIVQHFKRLFCTDIELFEEPNKYLYRIVGYGYDATHEEECIIFQSLASDTRIFTREVTEFMSKVDKVKYPNCSQEYRFVEVTIK